LSVTGVRVLIADPVRARRSALRAVLERRDFEVCADVEDVRDAIVAVERERPDVCLVDPAIATPAFEAVVPIRDAAPGLSVVIIGDAPSDVELIEAGAAGASGYLARTSPPSALQAALTDVVAGRSAFPRRLETLLVAALRRGAISLR
jgi:two-component system invasion response regulator UvrY